MTYVRGELKIVLTLQLEVTMNIFESTKAGKMSIAKRKLVCGVGINDVDFVCTLVVEGKTKLYKPYSHWMNMLKRCYDKSFHDRRPTYLNTSVCNEWLSFSSFLSWHKDHYVEGWCLDKDILGDGSYYSKETCIYVPKQINNFIEDSSAIRSSLGIGVNRTASGSFHSYCRDPFLNKRVNIGYFNNLYQAQQARLSYKLGLVEKYKSYFDQIDIRIYPKVKEIVMLQR